ncbi:hypothetical protein C8Q72DRAFT_881098 [Fomitopsis betulina]|nr:hypothetical protein C8Q72DRAFT_881098 [Fomitopsis betulina]
MPRPAVSADDFQRVSPHIVKVHPRRISQFNNTWEMISVIRDLILTHKLYFEAGFIHRHISEANVWILDGKGENGNTRSAGALLELDSSYWCRRYTRGEEEADDDEMEVLEVD